MASSSCLECSSGHPIVKYKRLRQWQGRVHKNRCGICTIEIAREQFRWRCEAHCEYNVCEDCFNDHWVDVMQRASKTENAKRRLKMLEAVPQHLLTTAEYREAERGPLEASAPIEAGVRPKKAHGSKAARVGSEAATPERCVKVKIAFWASLWLGAMLLMAFATRALLLDKALGFPSTLLMMGLSNMVTYVLLQLTVTMCRCCVHLGTDPEFKAAGLFGAMRCVQIALSTSAMCSSESYHNEILMSYVVTVFIVQMMNGKEKAHPVMAFSVLLAMVGGVLTVSARGTHSVETLKSSKFPMGFQIISLVVGSLRLVMSQNFLVKEDPAQKLPKVSPLVLATRMTPGIAIASFELACITGPGCFDTMMHLPEKNYIFLLLFVIGLANAVVLVAELQLLQRTSATLLGFLLACSSICVVLLSELHVGVQWGHAGVQWPTLHVGVQWVHVPVLMFVGAAVYALALFLYACARFCGGGETNGSEHQEDAAAYRRLEGGERERRSQRKIRENRGQSRSG